MTWAELMDAQRPHERDYIDRVTATVRQHRDADNSWPQWANVLADAVLDERALADLLALAIGHHADETDYCIICDCHPSHGHAEGCVIPRISHTSVVSADEGRPG